jgi:hypothetical protein
MINKRKSRAFGKDIYLIGQDEQGINYWLEAPSWDCGWYWGFGYIETYTNNECPEHSRDIDSHSHWSGLIGVQTHYDWEKKCEVKDEYIHHVNQNKMFAQTVLTDKESWELSDLMKRWEAMKEMAEILHSGTGHLTSSGKHKTKNDEFLKWINKVELPELFKAAIKILEPKSLEL